MAITANDVRLMASQRMTDNLDGGGRITGTAILDGVENNLFSDIGSLDRIYGRTQLRKVFAAVLSADQDTYIGAHTVLDDLPDDPAVSACVFAFGGFTTERAAAVAALEDAVDAVINNANYQFSGTATAASVNVTSYSLTPGTSATWDAEMLGQWVLVTSGTAAAFRCILSRDVTNIVLNEALPFSGAVVGQRADFLARSAGVSVFGSASIVGTLSNGAPSVPVVSAVVRIAPFLDGSAAPTAPASTLGIDAAKCNTTHGRLLWVYPGDAVLIHHTASTAPQTVSNGQTVTLPRDRLARLRVIGNNGTVHATFQFGAPAPGGVGCTADLVAGTITFSDVSGLSQPITLEHRIEDATTVASISGNTLTLTRAVSHDFPSGTRVSSLLVHGDLQGRAQDGFAQQAWTAVWSDSRIGAEILADFNHTTYPITTTNQGAISERWAVIFTSTTTYRVIGEYVGEVATGSTGAACSPINPVTGVPFFTIPAAGWGTGWASGNVYRFNTVGAQAPLWVLRCVAPSDPAGADSLTLQLRGDTNA